VTPTTLRSALAALLAGQLGTYTTPSSSNPPAALYVGNPPSDWRATGLEVIISATPEFATEPLHQHTSVGTEVPVRFVAHGEAAQAALTTAVTRVSQRFLTSNPQPMPPNESLGIPAQVILRVRST